MSKVTAVIIGIIIGLIAGFFGGYYYKDLEAENVPMGSDLIREPQQKEQRPKGISEAIIKQLVRESVVYGITRAFDPEEYDYDDSKLNQAQSYNHSRSQVLLKRLIPSAQAQFRDIIKEGGRTSEGKR